MLLHAKYPLGACASVLKKKRVLLSACELALFLFFSMMSARQLLKETEKNTPSGGKFRDGQIRLSTALGCTLFIFHTIFTSDILHAQ